MNTPRILIPHRLLSLAAASMALAVGFPALQAAEAPACKTCTDKKCEAPKPPEDNNGWKSLFDGKSLNGWVQTKFIGKGKVEVKDGTIVLGVGNDQTGVTFADTNALPRLNYEVEFQAKRAAGSDFFCGFTFPVAKSYCTFVVGGWGGSVVGISSVDGMDASENETTKSMEFVKDRWYSFRVRVTTEKLECWVDSEQVADVTTTGKKISMRFGEIEESAPFGFASYNTAGVLRNIRLRRIE